MKTHILLALFSSLIYGHALHSMTITEDALKERVTEMSQRVTEEPTQSYELVSKFLEEQPEQVTWKDEKTGNTNLHDYVIAFCQNQKPLRFIGAAALFAHGANPNTPNNKQKSALDIAKKHNNTLLVALFDLKKMDLKALMDLVDKHE